MSEWTAHVLTRAGRKLQAKVEAGATLDLTKIKIGSGMETLDEVDDLVDLVAAETEIAISAVLVAGEQCKVTGILRTASLAHGFYGRELGIFANDPDDGEILYAILIDEKPDWLPSDAPTELTVTYEINIAIANGTNVTAIVDPAGLVDVDMLNAFTHTNTRLTQYKAGEVLNAPTIPHGLVLECQSGGKTAEILPDFSRLSCGDTILDGTVLWKAKRPMLAPSMAYYYLPEWIYMAIGRLVQFAQSVQQGAADVEDINGRIVNVGGSGKDVDVDSIFIDDDKYAGTVFFYYGDTSPMSNLYAWIRSDDVGGEIINARPRIVLEDGGVISKTKGKVLCSNGVYYYTDTVSKEPVINGGGSQQDIATDDEVDEALDPYFPDDGVASDAEVASILDELLPAPNHTANAETGTGTDSGD